jgi:hypothetical protein
MLTALEKPLEIEGQALTVADKKTVGKVGQFHTALLG